MLDLGKKNPRLYIGFLWLSAALIAVVAPIVAVYKEQVSQNTLFAVSILLVMLPTGIAYLTLLIDIIKAFKFWLLLLVPLVFFPRILILMMGIGPLGYLVFLTYMFMKLPKEISNE